MGNTCEAGCGMLQVMKALTFFALVVASVSVHAAPLLAEYRHAQAQAIADCGAAQDPAPCVTQRSAEVKAQYKTIMATLSEAPAKEALTNVQVAFMQALNGASPNPYESSRSASSRFAGLTEKLSEAWTRLELALP
jgi:uncharacterized protein YecT (DUF1311 family)